MGWEPSPEHTGWFGGFALFSPGIRSDGSIGRMASINGLVDGVEGRPDDESGPSEVDLQAPEGAEVYCLYFGFHS